MNEPDEFAQALRDDQRFGAEIAHNTRVNAVNAKDLERHRRNLLESTGGWGTIDLDEETGKRLVDAADDADMTVADFLKHLLIKYAPQVYMVVIPEEHLALGRAHWPGISDEKVVENMVVAGAKRLARKR